MKRIILFLCVLLSCLILQSPAMAVITPITDKNQMQPEHLIENRHFAAMSSIEVTGSRLWAAWTSGGDCEPHDDNYIVVAFSDDDGESWNDPYMILDPGSLSRSCVPILWIDPAERLWLFYSAGSYGTYVMYTDNPSDTPDAILWSEPQKITPYHVTNKPIVIDKDGTTSYLLCVQNMVSNSITQLLQYTQENNKWSLVRRSFAKSTNEHNVFMEASMVQKLDGSLWMLTRIDGGHDGGVEQAFSYDLGASWTALSSDTSYPLKGPGSRALIQRLQSGNLAWVGHDSTTSRTNLTIWLSEDDGATWPHKLLLDGRSSVSYPHLAQKEDGTIYVIYDKGRSREQEIRFARFTEADIIAGAFVTESAQDKIVISKTGGYEDILIVNELSNQEYILESENALNDFVATLPTELHIVTDSSDQYTLAGQWETATSKEHEVTLKFSTKLPTKVQDTYDYLTILVKW